MSAIVNFPPLSRKPRMILIYRPDGSFFAWDRDMSLAVLAHRYGMAGYELICHGWKIQLRRIVI